jgi:roadblock/LC7 domain-containing protein
LRELYIIYFYKEKIFMKSLKKIAAIAAAVTAVSAMGMSVSAADWSQTSYADNDPTIVTIVQADDTGVIYKNNQNPDIAKVRITLDKILKNPDDYAKIAKVTYQVEYHGITSDLQTEGEIGGGAWLTNQNANNYSFQPSSYDENDMPVWEEGTYITTDELIVPDDMPLEKDGEFVFMDWSRANLGAQGVTIQISELHLYDKDGNEIEQLGYGEYGNVTAEETATEEAAPATETAAEETPAATEESTPGSDNVVGTEEDNAKTGNEVPAAAAAIFAVSAVAAVATRKRK